MIRALSKSIPMMVIISLLLIVMVASMILIMTGQQQAAWLVGNLSPFIIMMGVLAFVVFKDSKKRWPEDNAWRRFAKVMTFSR